MQVQSSLVFGPQNRQPATATGLNWLQLVATSISKKRSKIVEICVFTHDFGGKSLVLYYVMHSEGIHTTNHDQIEQHISKKKSFLGHFCRDFCKYCYIIKDQLLTISPNWLQVWFSPVFVPVHRTGPANTTMALLEALFICQMMPPF